MYMYTHIIALKPCRFLCLFMGTLLPGSDPFDAVYRLCASKDNVTQWKTLHTVQCRRLLSSVIGVEVRLGHIK